MKSRYRSKGFIVGSVSALLFFCLTVFVLPIIMEERYIAQTSEISGKTKSIATTTPVFIVTHLPTPEPLKAIYMSACVASTKDWKNSLVKLIKDTELNALVIDIKDYSGTVSLVDGDLQASDAPGCKVKDMKEFIGELHKNNIYVIGRVTVFQDPYFTKRNPTLAVQSKSSEGVWKDKKGLSFVDVGAREYWDYIVKLSKASYIVGFDEINFDYIRYPSDGNMQDAEYKWTVGTSTRAVMLESFFSYLHNSLKNTGMKTSADIFGQATIEKTDMGIGQILEKTLPYFDYVYPMVYPSHYTYNTAGLGNPATQPYEIVKYSMSSALEREKAFNFKNGLATSTPSKLRPWLQDFDLGAKYGFPEVQAQMKATYDAGLTSWLFWDAGNKYTKEAFLPI